VTAFSTTKTTGPGTWGWQQVERQTEPAGETSCETGVQADDDVDGDVDVVVWVAVVDAVAVGPGGAAATARLLGPMSSMVVAVLVVVVALVVVRLLLFHVAGAVGTAEAVSEYETNVVSAFEAACTARSTSPPPPPPVPWCWGGQLTSHVGGSGLRYPTCGAAAGVLFAYRAAENARPDAPLT
jgi:hypothetical protein